MSQEFVTVGNPLSGGYGQFLQRYEALVESQSGQGRRMAVLACRYFCRFSLWRRSTTLI